MASARFLDFSSIETSKEARSLASTAWSLHQYIGRFLGVPYRKTVTPFDLETQDLDLVRSICTALWCIKWEIGIRLSIVSCSVFRCCIMSKYLSHFALYVSLVSFCVLSGPEFSNQSQRVPYYKFTHSAGHARTSCGSWNAPMHALVSEAESAQAQCHLRNGLRSAD
jgi:hypothetical protein